MAAAGKGPVGIERASTSSRHMFQAPAIGGKRMFLQMKIALIGIVGAASMVVAADAGFLGFVASVRTVGANTVIDIYAGVGNASDKFLNVYNANISTTLAGGFVQKAGNSSKTWKPDTVDFTSTKATSDDSFMTAGGFAYGGTYYASGTTSADPNFTGTSWTGAPGSPPANTVPTNAGWYTGDPTSTNNNAESLASLVGRVNAGATAASGNTAGSVGGATANFGIWCGHLVVAGTGTMGTDILWSASMSIKDGVTGVTDQRISTFAAVPAPGALALLGIAGFASRRRRA